MNALAAGVCNTAGNHSLLHQQEDRAKSYAALPPISWDENLQAWLVTNAELIRKLLLVPELEVIDFRDVYRRIGQRLGQDFSATLQVLDHVALGLAGAEHSRARREQTLWLKSRMEPALSAFCGVLDDRLRGLLVHGGRADLVSDLIAPAMAALFSELTGFAAETDRQNTLSQIFDRYLSLNRRKAIDRRIKEKFADDHLSDGKDDPDQEMRISLTVVGADSIHGAFCDSLAHILRRNPGVSLSAIEWPVDLPHTGVPYADRFAVSDLEVAGHRIAKGERLRLFVDVFAFDDQTPNSALFGAGSHVCLGKAISIRAWGELAARLSQVDAGLRLVNHGYRRADFLFNYPMTVEVDICHE